MSESIQTPGYLFDGLNYDDRERLVLSNQFTRETSNDMIELAQKYYDLGSDGHVRALDVGSGEGLYLFELAQSSRFAHFEGLGVDKDGEAIETAHTYAQIEGIQNLRFAVFDVTQPLADCLAIRTSQPFDLVMESLVLMHLRNPHNILAEMTATLRPGGIMLLADSAVTPEASFYPHSSFAVFWSAIVKLVAMSSGGFHVAHNHETMLHDAGFREMISMNRTNILGGPTPQGKATLEILVLAFKNARPVIVDRMQWLSGAEFDEHLRRLQTEATSDMVGTVTSRQTIARKPL